MSKTIALNGNVITIPVPPFSPGSVIYTNGTKIKVNSTWVITQAVCTFTSSGPVPPPGTTEVVTLNGSSNKLKDNSTKIIRNGDIVTGTTWGNQLQAVVSQTKLKSA